MSIVNALLDGSAFLDEWKEVIVIEIHKSYKSKDQANSQANQHKSSNRPGSLLNTLGKIYGSIILARLKAIVIEKRLPLDKQFQSFQSLRGFRVFHSYTH